MRILAIETSCDETALSIIESDDITRDDNFRVLSDLVISQIDVHAPYGGVFPALAKREHAKNLVPLLQQALFESGSIEKHAINFTNSVAQEILDREPELYTSICDFFSKNKLPHIDIIMVTNGPGLAPALWVGVNFARALSVILDAPILPVNHMEGHICSILVKDNYKHEDKALMDISSFTFPMISLLISGGHTQLILVKDWNKYEIIGETIDDAVGEAFDKTARMLGLPYPGGPHLSELARKSVKDEQIVFPRPMIHSGDYRFSFSGLKTAVRYLVEEFNEQGILSEQAKSNIANEFQHAVADVLVKKSRDAMIQYNAKGLIIAGGVSANDYIIDQFKKLLSNEFDDAVLFQSQKKLCGDNSLMIATSGFVNYLKEKDSAFVKQEHLMADGNLKI